MEEIKKRKRGRPKKIKLPDEVQSIIDATQQAQAKEEKEFIQIQRKIQSELILNGITQLVRLYLFLIEHNPMKYVDINQQMKHIVLILIHHGLQKLEIILKRQDTIVNINSDLNYIEISGIKSIKDVVTE